MTNSGMFNIENGDRCAVAKRGYKWTYLFFLDGSKIRRKRIRSHKVGQPKEFVGSRSYTTAELAQRFLTAKTLNGTRYQIGKAAKRTLKAIAGEAL